MRNYYFMFGEGSKINQVLCAILINLPVFAYGASIGWMSPMSLYLQSDNPLRKTPLTDTEISWMAAIPYLTSLPGYYMMAALSDNIGRRYSCLIISIAAVGCWVLKLSSMEMWAFITARVLVGITMAGSYAVCPIYIKEISENNIRGTLGSLISMAHTCGNLFLYIIGDVMSYRAVLWVCLALPIIHLSLFLMMPETPSYLMKNGNIEEATRVLAWLRCRREDDAVVVQELDAIRKEQKADDESKHYALKAIVKDKILLKAFGIAMIITLSREVCGATPVLNFAGEIFDRASKGSGLVLTPNQQAMMLGTVQIAGSAVASSLIEKAGRKPLMFTATLVSGISMCVLASWFLARDYDVTPPAWIPVLTLCVSIFCDSAGLLPLAVVFIGEMFSYKYRSIVLATAMGIASFADFIEMLCFKPLANAVGVHVAFYIFGGFCLLSAVYVALVVPETKVRTVEEIYKELGKKDKNTEVEHNDTEKCDV